MTQTNAIFSSEQKSGRSQSQVPSGSFYEVLQAVRDQINIECFFREDWDQVNELFLIIAEMYKLPPLAEVQINGQKLPASLVQEVYLLLTEDHIRRVIQNFEAATYTVKFKKTYIRTALYNVVFEYESGNVNDFRTDFPEVPTHRHG